MRRDLNRIVINGGVLSPGELKYICEAAESLGLDTISFGSRQDILFPEEIDQEKLKQFDRLRTINPGEKEAHNLVSSYVSSDILPNTRWLTGSRYLYILEEFKYDLKLRVNIVDPKQRLVPLFTGHLNFIASEHEDYWYLYVRLPEWNKTEMYPVLIYSFDLDETEKAIEKVLIEEPENVQTLFELVNDAVDTNNKVVDKPLEVPFYPFPYYEGMHRIDAGKYWLGLYWRNNRYDIDFLKAMCDLCAENKIGKISITPWKSFIVKGIPLESKLKWEKFLGKYGINVRHSSLELNWDLPVDDVDALNLKKYLVANFDQNDISTYGLTFGITKRDSDKVNFTSVVIEKNKQPENLQDFVIRDTYNLLYAKDFDPNNLEYVMHVQDVDKVELPGLLMELSQLYFEQLGNIKDDSDTQEQVKDKSSSEEEIYQCTCCQTVYNEVYGDVTQDIAPNTPFEKLSDDYVCPLCEAPKSSFEKKILVKNY